MNLFESRGWSLDELPTANLFVDAASVPPRVGAVLLYDDTLLYSDMEPGENVLRFFQTRDDNQIMSLELLAIAFGLSSFGEIIKGRRVYVWSDNTGSEHATRKGAAKAFDHCCVVHSIWSKAAEIGIDMQVGRVATEANIADLPSRGQYDLLGRLGALRAAPLLEERFCKPDAWEALSVKNLFG